VADRIRFLARLSTDDFLQLLAAVPVVLDTLHFGGGTTSFMAMAAGTPVVTMPSEFMRGRVMHACYKQMGMMDCVAKSPAQYVKTAVRLGTDCAFREATKQKILARNHVLYENHNVVTEYERFFLAALKASQVRTKKKAVSAGGSTKRRASADQK
jgi:predicted O-linked N-acetylglucosamine transferase (SPINDLY family)